MNATSAVPKPIKQYNQTRKRKSSRQTEPFGWRAGRKADPQHSSPVLDGECILAEYSTLAEFTFGLPRYHIAFTSHRIILKQKCRFLGLCGKESEQFICYRHVQLKSQVQLGPNPVTASSGLLQICFKLLYWYIDCKTAAFAFCQ
jgi:hypothetical protein